MSGKIPQETFIKKSIYLDWKIVDDDPSSKVVHFIDY